MKFHPQKWTRGFTLIEVLIAMTITITLLSIVVAYMNSSWRSHHLVKVQAYLKTQSQASLFRLSKQINQLKLIIDSSSDASYPAKLNLSGAPDPIAQSVLPTIRATGSLSPEKNCQDFPNNFFRSNSVGNSFLYVERVGSFSDFGLTSRKKAIDLYRFNYLYITEAPASTGSQRLIIKGSSQSYPVRRLIQWRSQVYLDYNQLVAVINDLAMEGTTEQSKIKSSLTTQGYTVAWDRSETVVNNSFYNVGTGVSTSLTRKPNSYKVEPARFFNALLLNSPDATYSLAYPKQTNSALPFYFPIRELNPKYFKANPANCPSDAKEVIPASSYPNLSGNPFSGGFEVMVVGPGSGRSILLSVNAVGQFGSVFAEQHHTVTVYAQDL